MAFLGTGNFTFSFLLRASLPAPVSLVGDHSIGCWVRFGNLLENHECVVINDSSGGGYAHAIFYDTTLGLLFTERNSTQAQKLDYFTAINANQWYHVALTWNQAAGQMTSYIDGVQVNQQTSALITARANWANLQFGPGIANYQDAFFYTVTLTPEQVQQNMMRRQPQRRDGLLIYLPAYPGADRVKDYSGNGIDFTPNSTPTDGTFDPPVSNVQAFKAVWYEADGGGSTADGGTVRSGSSAASAAAAGGDTRGGSSVASGAAVGGDTRAGTGAASAFGAGGDTRSGSGAASAFGRGGDTRSGTSGASAFAIGGDTRGGVAMASAAATTAPGGDVRSGAALIQVIAAGGTIRGGTSAASGALAAGGTIRGGLAAAGIFAIGGDTRGGFAAPLAAANTAPGGDSRGGYALLSGGGGGAGYLRRASWTRARRIQTGTLRRRIR